jgi:hypothetical protein
MATPANSLSALDRRSFFERTLAYGVDHGILSELQLERIREDGAKGIVQIANHFGTAYLQASLETAATRMVNLISLYLEDKTDGNLQMAAISLRDHSLLSHSRGGSELLKRLNALPQDTQLVKGQAIPADEKSFVDDRTFAAPFSLSEYRKEVLNRLEIQRTTDFARWVAGQLKARAEEYCDYQAEEIINSALLVWYVGQEPCAFPTKSGFIKLVDQLRRPGFKPRAAPFDRLLAGAPDEFGRQARAALQTFIKAQLPKLKSSENKPADFLFGDLAGIYFVRESLEEEVGEFDQMVAREWVRITKGKTDPATIATVFLFIATGQPPKATALQKEAKDIISRFRTSGFDSDAVCRFIDQHAPPEQQRELRTMWLEDLKPEAEVQLADPDEDDTYMDRALPYLKQTCVAAWKGRA